MKDSGVEWLGEIPSHWDVTHVKRVATNKTLSFVDGDWIESPYITESGVRLLQTGNIGVGEYREQGYRYISEETFNELGCTEVFPNDVLICRLAEPVGRACLAPDLGARMITSVDVCILRPNTDFDATFVVYFLSSSAYLDWLEALARGSTRSRISRTMLGNTEIVSPPLAEQRAIAAYLDRETAKIESLIGETEALNALLLEKRVALISQAVTKGLDPAAPLKDSGVAWLGEIPAHWDVKRLKHVTTYVGSGKTPKGGSEIYQSSGVLFIRSQNVHFDGLRLSDVAFISHEIDAEMRSTRVQTFDVLLNITGASLGRCSVVTPDIPAANVNQHVCIVRPFRRHIDPEFLKNQIASETVQSQIFATENGSSREGITFQQICDFWIAVPKDVTEQRAIAALLDRETAKIDALIAKNDQLIALLREKRTALISAAVTGKIDLRHEV